MASLSTRPSAADSSEMAERELSGKDNSGADERRASEEDRDGGDAESTSSPSASRPTASAGDTSKAEASKASQDDGAGESGPPEAAPVSSAQSVENQEEPPPSSVEQERLQSCASKEHPPRDGTCTSSRLSSYKAASDDPEDSSNGSYHSSSSGLVEDIPSKTDVVIVGAGPTGLALGLLLARQGVDFLLLDASFSPTKGSRAVALHSRSLEILEDLGVAGSLLALGHRCKGMRVWLAGQEAGEVFGEQVLSSVSAANHLPTLKSLSTFSKHLGALSPPESLEGASSLGGPFPFSLMLPQSVTEQVLETHLNELGHKVRRAVQVRQVRCLDAEEPPFYPVATGEEDENVGQKSALLSDVSERSSSDEDFFSPAPPEGDLSNSASQEGGSTPVVSRSLEWCTFSVSSIDQDAQQREAGLPLGSSLLGHPVVVQFAVSSLSGEPRSSGEVRCRYVVACDGSQSELRSRACIQMIDKSSSPRYSYIGADVELAGETSVASRNSLRLREDSGGALLLQAQLLEQQEALHRIMLDESEAGVSGGGVGGVPSGDGVSSPGAFALGLLPALREGKVLETFDHLKKQLTAAAASAAEKASSVAASAFNSTAALALQRQHKTASAAEAPTPAAFLSHSAGSFVELHLSDKGFAVCFPLTHSPVPVEVAEACAPHRKASLASLRARRCSTGLAEVQGFHWRVLLGRAENASSSLQRNRVLAGPSCNPRQSALSESSNRHGLAPSPSSNNAGFLQSAKTLDLASSRCLHLPVQRSESGTFLRVGVTGGEEREDVAATIEDMLPGCRVTRVFACERYPTQPRRAKEFKFARLLLAGDAAHTLDPILSNGMNLGIQDAYNLGWKLARVLRHGASTQLLWTYSEESQQAAAQLERASDRFFLCMRSTVAATTLMPPCLTRVVAPVAVNLSGVCNGFGGLLSMCSLFYSQPRGMRVTHAKGVRICSPCLGVSSMPPFTSVLPGMRVPDCLMKVARAPRVGALGLPSAVVGYLFELLGKGRHVLLLHLQLLPPGSRKQNIFGCEMPNAPLVPRYNSEVVSSLVRLVQLATLAATKTPQPAENAPIKSKVSAAPELLDSVRSKGPFSAADFEGFAQRLENRVRSNPPTKRRSSGDSREKAKKSGDERASSIASSQTGNGRSSALTCSSLDGSSAPRSVWGSELRVLWCLHGPGTAAALHTTVTSTSITSQIVRSNEPSKAPPQRRSVFLPRRKGSSSSQAALEVQSSSGEWAEDECQLLQRPVLEMLPPALVRALQQIPGGCGGFVLMDFLQDMQMKMGLQLEDPHSSLGAEASGGFSLVRPDGFLAYTGRAGDSQAARAMLDYLVKY